MIVCTHSHPDHSPGASRCRPCAARRPPILGPAFRAHGAQRQRLHTRQRARKTRNCLTLASQGPGGETVTHTLKVLHTPGHAANHVCLVLEEDGLLFSGDHILNGSTTVIDPPDGDMNAYLESLDVLSAACGEAPH